MQVTVKEALNKGTAFLKAEGIDSARLEIELMIARSLATDRLGLYLNLDRVMTDAERETSREMLRRRREREPLAYILGQREFYGLEFEVTPQTLIPRPETELLVDRALKFLKARYAPPSETESDQAPLETPSDSPPIEAATSPSTTTPSVERVIELDDPPDFESAPDPDDQPADAASPTAPTDQPPPEQPQTPDRPADLFVDIGTGSGAIAVACAVTMQRRDWPGRWIATDLSEGALAVARRNAELHAVEDRIDFRCGDLFEPIADLRGAVTAICSNPPYVAENERPELAPEVGKWEPQSALFSGPDGLDHLRRLTSEAADYLVPGGILLLEIGYRQAADVRAMLEAAGAYKTIETHSDLAGHDRIIEATKA